MRLKLAVAAFAIAMVAPPNAASAYPGDLDPAFSMDGIALPRPGQGTPGHIDVQSSGRTIVAAGNKRLTITRLTERGTVDKTFAGGGRSTTVFSCDPAVGVVVASDNSIFAASNDCLVKLDPNGVLDETFSDDGVVSGFQISDLALDGSGRPLIAGLEAGRDATYVGRFEPDGDPDPGFSEDGDAQIEQMGFSRTDLTTSGDVVYVGGLVSPDPAVAKLGSDGELDSSFGSGGIAPYDNSLGLGAWVGDISLTDSGDVLLAGSLETFTSGRGFVSKFDSQGDVITTFGTNGAYLENRGGQLNAVLPREDGTILVGGETGFFCRSVDIYCISQRDGVLLQLTSSGTPDESFGDHGDFVVDLDGFDLISDLALSSTPARLLAGGSAQFECCDENERTFVSRHLLSGARRDRDADGFRDEADACPTRYANVAGGCPTYPRRIRLDDVEQREDGIHIAGGIDSPAEPCIFAADPALERKTPTGWRREAYDDAAVPDGPFDFTIDHDTHRHRLTLSVDRAEGQAICGAARPVSLPG